VSRIRNDLSQAPASRNDAILQTPGPPASPASV